MRNKRVKTVSLLLLFLLSLAVWDNISAPEDCVMCGFRYHAPCLLELSTGEMGEIRLYPPDSRKVAEIAPEKTNAALEFHYIGEVDLIIDTISQTARFELPKGISLMNRSLFCRPCREKLRAYAFDGYVIVDTYEKDDPKVYPITDGICLEMRCYQITAENTDGDMQVKVVGNALPENFWEGQ